jgi:hypothetical protein
MNSEALSELETLSPAEAERLKDLENVIETGIKRVIQLGEALLEIRDSRLYRASHRRFEDYVKERFGFSRARSAQLIAHSSILQNLALSGCEIQPSSDDRVRYLAAVDPADRSAVWELACQVAGGQPTSSQVKEVRDRLGVRVDHCKGRSRDAFKRELSPEGWLARGQELVATQRRADFELGDWFNQGEDRFSDAHKLIEEVIWNGPTTQELRRRAKVAQIVPVAKRDSLSFETAAKVITINKPEILEQCESEQEILEAVASVRNAERVAKIQHERAGTPAEHDEVRTELEHMVPKLYRGLLNFFGESCERQVLDFLSEFIRFRFDSLKDKAR